tara:strand:- start:1126 stop:1938 length:813 start_codon:yes stop_codon:yes gene_type:complete
MKDILLYPKNATLYQGLNSLNSFDNWVTDDIGYASTYALKTNKSVIKTYSTNKYLKLLNIKTIKLKSLSKKKTIIIKSKNSKKKLKLSIRKLYKIIFGRGCIKTPSVKTENDIKDLEKFHPRFKNTQCYLICQILSIFGIYYKKKFIKRLRKTIYLKNKNKIKIIQNKKDFNRISENKIKIIQNKKDFNRISEHIIDILFLNNLKKHFPNLDGYYAPDLKNDYHLIILPHNYYLGEQKAEIGLFNFNNLKLNTIIKNPKLIYNLFFKNKK